jgi:hypothetical protein
LSVNVATFSVNCRRRDNHREHRDCSTEPLLNSATKGVGLARQYDIKTRTREGRKYGVSLALISQRPSELSAQALSQCGTIFALRLANELDQRFMETVMPDAARGNLATLSSLGTQEAIVCGEGVPLPTRVRFDDLPRARRPRSEAPTSRKLGRLLQPMRVSATRGCAAGASKAANASPSSESPSSEPRVISRPQTE